MFIFLCFISTREIDEYMNLTKISANAVSILFENNFFIGMID